MFIRHNSENIGPLREESQLPKMSPIGNRCIDILHIFPSSHLSAGPFSVSASLSNVDHPACFP